MAIAAPRGGASIGVPHKAPAISGGHGAPINHGRAAAVRATQTGSGVANRPANWLQPLTPQQVVNQAESMVKTSYTPAYDAVNQESNMENGILSKQESDNHFYQQWLDAKSNALQANQAQVESTTNALEQQLTGNQSTAFNEEPSQLTADANARAGNVSNNNPSFMSGESAIGNALSANQTGLENELGGAATQALATERANAGGLNAAIANTGAVVNAGGAKELGAYNNAMLKIAGERSSLGSKEASALMSEIARLQGVQISVSENNRNYNTAVQKLGISAANTASEMAARAATTKLNQQKFQQTVSQNEFNDAVKNQQLGQNAQKIAISLANSNSENALRNAEIAAKYGPNGGYLTVDSQNTIIQQIQRSAGTINGLIQQGMKPNVAYSAVLNGYYYTTKTLSSGKTETVRVSVPRMSNQGLLNAAYNLSAANNGLGLNQNDVKYLEQLHLQPGNITSNLKVQSAAQQGAANAASNAGKAVANALGGLRL